MIFATKAERLRKTFDRLEDARNFNKQPIGDISKGDFVAPSDVTVKDIAESWYKRKNDAGTYRHGTLHNWRIHIDKHIVPALGDLRIQGAMVEQIETPRPFGLRLPLLKKPTRS